MSISLLISQILKNILGAYQHFTWPWSACSMKPWTVCDPLFLSVSYHRESLVELDLLVPLEPVVPLETLACLV